jgi:subtilisin family serine protease
MALRTRRIAAALAAAVAALASTQAALASPPLLTTADPATGRPYEWQYAAANVGPALAISAGSPTVRVGIIDTGAADVPDLAGKVDERWTVSQNGKLTRDTHAFDAAGHGTAVSSLIAANGFGMAGFGGETHLVVIRDWTLTAVSVAAALMKLDSLGVRIVNMSFGSPAALAPVELKAIRKVTADGMLLIAATGNSASGVAHPAADLQGPDGQESYGLAVGASDANGNLAFFSNRGANLSLVAPGVFSDGCSGVLTAIPTTTEPFTNGGDAVPCYPNWDGSGGARYAYLPGTSFAAPEVAGIAALVWAARPGLKNYQVADIIKQSARRDGGWSATLGCGVLDAGAALELATSRTDAEWASTPRSQASCQA